MVILKFRRTVAPLAIVGLVLGLFVSASYASAQAQCGTRLTQDLQSHPAFSGTLPNLLSTAGNDKYLYEATQYGFARASLANPSSPGPLQLLQIGQKFAGGDNGGLIYLGCDCYQGASMIDAAEAPDGSSRMISDWVANYQGVLKGMVGTSVAGRAPEFGDQINIAPVSLGATVAAIYSPGTGKYFGYFPSSTLQIVDLTNPNGSTNSTLALNVIGTFGAWSGASVLKAGTVSMGGLPKMLLAGYVVGTIHIAEIDGNSGMPVERASAVALGGSNALYIANVNGKVYVFSADYAAGLNVYEYTGSALTFAGNLPGYINNVVVKGNPGNSFPAIFVHRGPTVALHTDAVDIWDSKWLSSGTPTLAYSLPHQGTAPPTGRGNALEAVVTGGGSQIIAHVYRLATTTNPLVNLEHLLITDNIDISCIAADTTSRPTASATFANVSAALRSGAERSINYYGDRFTLTDNSSTGVPITRVDWDINNAGSPAALVPDAVGTATSLPNIFFPCDPAGTIPGDITGGSNNCAASLGLSSTPANQTFAFAEKSTNQNGQSDNTFYSTAIPFVMPQIGIVNLSGGVLRVLTGVAGGADATPTQGNTADATFLWSFTGGPGGTAGTITAPVPLGATGFSLTVTWRGGYVRTLSGSIVQTDLVPSFSMSPNPATVSGTVTLTNTMQKSPTTALTSVDSSVVAGSCPGSPSFTGTLPGAFSTPGTATLTAPATVGPYCVTLKYNYTPNLQAPTNQTVSNPLTVVVQTAPLSASVSGPGSGTVGTALSYSASPAGGAGGYTYEWDCNYSSFSGGSWQAGTSSQNCTFNNNGTYTPAVRVTDSASARATGFGYVSITGGSSGPVSASVFGPSTGSIGSPLTFSASATGGSGSYSYAWACEYTVLRGSSQFIPGSSSNSCTYNTNGTETVAVRVTDSGTGSAIAQTTVSIGGSGGPGPGGVSVSITGPTTGSANSALSYTASASGGTAPYTYAWACDYNSLGGSSQFVTGAATASCTFANNGTHVVAVRATDSVSNVATNTTTTIISGPALPSAAFTISGGTLVSGSTYKVPAGQPVVFTAAEPNATSWGWNFGDSTLANARTVTKAYAATGTYQGQLIVTGDGTGASGVNIATFTIQAVIPAPSGAFTITGAASNLDGTVFTASVGEEITMTASEPNALSWGWIFGDDTSGAAKTVKKTYSALGSYTAKLLVTGNERETTGLSISTFTINIVSCAPNVSTLCLNDNRFRATVAWSVPPQDKSGAGSGVALTADTGYYWFFTPSNIELVLKVVDGRAFNGKYWVFYGALSNVEYTITVKDMKTGAVKTYRNPYGNTASLADVNAFDPGPGSTMESASKRTAAASAISVICAPAAAVTGQQVTCTASPEGSSYSWNFGDDFPPRLTAGPNPITHTFSSAGTYRVTASADAGITVGYANVAVTSPGTGVLSAAIAGPTTGEAGALLSFTGTATGGTGPYTYAWNCDYNASAPTFTAGSATSSCTWSSAGPHVVGLRVTDSATPTPGQSVATSLVSVTAPAGPGLPSFAFTVSGATLNPATGKYEAEAGQTITFTASEANAASWAWAFGDGQTATGQSATHAYPLGGDYTVGLTVTGDTTHTIGTSTASIPMAILACAMDSKTLCLNAGRFKVRVDWKSPTSSGAGNAVPVTADTGEFWFLSGNNIELVLKVVDGTTLNGHFWVFYGALSDLEYTITVTDTNTGAVKTYHNPQGTTASVADVNAF